MQAGTVVYMKGQRVAMVVKSVGNVDGKGNALINCMWMDEADKVQEGTFPEVILETEKDRDDATKKLFDELTQTEQELKLDAVPAEPTDKPAAPKKEKKAENA